MSTNVLGTDFWSKNLPYIVPEYILIFSQVFFWFTFLINIRKKSTYEYFSLFFFIFFFLISYPFMSKCMQRNTVFSGSLFCIWAHKVKNWNLTQIKYFYTKSQVFRSFFLGYVRNILHFCWVYANLATDCIPLTKNIVLRISFSEHCSVPG